MRSNTQRSLSVWCLVAATVSKPVAPTWPKRNKTFQGPKSCFFFWGGEGHFQNIPVTQHKNRARSVARNLGPSGPKRKQTVQCPRHKSSLALSYSRLCFFAVVAQKSKPTFRGLESFSSAMHSPSAMSVQHAKTPKAGRSGRHFPAKKKNRWEPTPWLDPVRH